MWASEGRRDIHDMLLGDEAYAALNLDERQRVSIEMHQNDMCKRRARPEETSSTYEELQGRR